MCDLGRPADLWFTQFMVTLIQWSNAEFLPALRAASSVEETTFGYGKMMPKRVGNCQLTSHVCILHPIFAAIQVRSRHQNPPFRFNRLDPACQGPGLRSPRK